MFGGLRAFKRTLLLCLALSLLAVAPGSAQALQVSMGDSYSSGEGAGKYDTATKLVVGNGCHRTGRAWPRLLGVPKEAHLACSGAKTIDFFTSHKRGPDATSQLDRLRALAAAHSISRVFVTIGGNDLGFSRIFKACIVPLDSCLDQMDEKELPRLHRVVRPDVIGALIATSQAAGGAEVLLVGYPDLIPANRKAIGCGWWLSNEEAKRVRRLQVEVDSTLLRAAQAAGAVYVSIRGALEGHELCSDEPWVNWVKNVTSPFLQEKGHPTSPGQKAMARAVERALDTGAGPPAAHLCRHRLAALDRLGLPAC